MRLEKRKAGWTATKAITHATNFTPEKHSLHIPAHQNAPPSLLTGCDVLWF